MADGQTNVQQNVNASQYLEGIPRGILYGLGGAVASAVAVNLTLLPPTILGVATSTAVGTSLFLIEWIQGLV